MEESNCAKHHEQEENQDTPKLERANFFFTQEPNCDSDSNGVERLIIDFQSSLGLDYDRGGYFVLSTDGWSVDDEQDLKRLFDRINSLMKQ